MQVKFNENNIAYVTFYKWDYGQELSFDSVPENSEVHFPVKGSEDAAVVRVTGNKCLVPNATLSMDLSSFDAWLYIDNGEQGKTKKTIHFTLIQRARPDGHIYSFELDQLLSLDGKLDKHQGAENAGKTFIIDNNGNAVVDHIPSIEIDSKLSENSSNPIANSAVAKVLSGGKLVGIETIYDYESLMDFNFKYYDFDNDKSLISDDEFVILFVLYDIYDESGEYGDNECLLKRALYFWNNYDTVVIGETRQEEVDALNKLLKEHSDNLVKLNTEIKDKAGIQNVINVATTSYGYYQETKTDVAEINEKLAELENSSVNKKYRLIADITTTEDTTYVLTTKDTNDNDFCLKKAKIFIETPAASAAEGILVKMSDVYENGTVTGGTLIIQLNAISTTARYCTIDIEANEYGAFAKGTQGTSMVLQNSVSGGYNPNVTAISKLLIRAHTAGNMLPAGTKIKIWGY